MQRGQAASSPCGFADACAELAGAGVRPGLHGAGGQEGSELVPFLQGGQVAHHRCAGWAWAVASARCSAGAAEPGAAVTGWRNVTYQHKLAGPLKPGRCSAATCGNTRVFGLPACLRRCDGPARILRNRTRQATHGYISRHNMRMPALTKLANPLCRRPAPVRSGGSVQQGLFAAIEVVAHDWHCGAADKRYSLGHRYHLIMQANS